MDGVNSVEGRGEKGGGKADTEKVGIRESSRVRHSPLNRPSICVVFAYIALA
jgi:hypothetical protein